MGIFHYFLIGWSAVAFISLVYLLKFPAPYGRFNRSGWGIQIPNKLAWVIMEIISPLTLWAIFLFSSHNNNILVLFFMIVWTIHYINRSFIFPFRTKTTGKTMPLSIALSAIFFNLVNGFANGYWFATFSNYTLDWFWDIRCIIGIVLFIIGFIINVQSDEILLNLRKSGEKAYKIPHGGMFKWITCPNYLGEMVEWIGFAVMCWSPAALVFVIWTISNLLPRALSNHKWYIENFTDYPDNRKALIPFIL